MTPEELAIIDSSKTRAAKYIIIGAIMAEYGAIILQRQKEPVLKQKVYELKKASQNVQNVFIKSKHLDPETSEAMKQEFNKNEILLMAEMLNVASYFDEHIMQQLLEHLRKI